MEVSAKGVRCYEVDIDGKRHVLSELQAGCLASDLLNALWEGAPLTDDSALIPNVLGAITQSVRGEKHAANWAALLLWDGPNRQFVLQTSCDGVEGLRVYKGWTRVGSNANDDRGTDEQAT